MPGIINRCAVKYGIRMIRKIDEKGNYCGYQGTTVICKINQNQKALWQRVHACIQNEVGASYSALPMQSYHMTAMSLYNQMDLSDKCWKTFIEGHLPFFQNLKINLEKNAFNPHVMIEEIIVCSVIQLRVKLPPEQEALFRTIAKHFKVENVPNEFHITLAYQFKDLTYEQQSCIQHKLSTIINNWCDIHDNHFDLNPATLSYFNDMTAFSHWDARSFPFERKTVSAPSPILVPPEPPLLIDKNSEETVSKGPN